MITGLIALSLFWLSVLSPRSPLSSPSPFSFLPNSVNLSRWSWLWRALRELITGLTGISPFDSPSSSPGHLYLPPPSSLLHVTLWTSLSVPHCGESFHHELRCFITCAVWMEKVEAIVRKDWKPEAGGLNQKLENTENSWLQVTLINRSSSKSLHTYTKTKLHPRANNFQSKTYHANSPAMQEHSPEH